MGLVGALKVRERCSRRQRISLGREVKDHWSKLQNFDIVMVYMRKAHEAHTVVMSPSWSIIIIQLPESWNCSPPETEASMTHSHRFFVVPFIDLKYVMITRSKRRSLVETPRVKTPR